MEDAKQRVRELLTSNSKMYVHDIYTIILRRKEIAVVPSIPGGVLFSVEDDVLMVSDQLASRMAREAQDRLKSGFCTDAVSVCILFCPELPQFVSFWSSLPKEELLRLTALSLRFHANSSTLWNVRQKVAVDTESEAAFLFELSGFKAFNYHLFRHWCQLVTGGSLLSIHLPYLKKIVARTPSNFSPFQVILAGLSKCEDVVGVLQKVLDVLGRFDTEAYREFLRGARLLLESRGVEIGDLPLGVEER